MKKDAQVTIANKIKELDEPDAPFIEVTKRFNGLTKEQIRELAKASPAYQITVTNGSDTRTLIMDADKLDENLTGKIQPGFTHGNWKIVQQELTELSSLIIKKMDIR